MATLANKFQFQALFSQLYTSVSTLDVASLVDAAGATSTVTVAGVQLGDIVLGVSLGVSTAGITVTANVTAADTVSVRFQNESGGTLDLASATLRLLVGRPDPAVFVA